MPARELFGREAPLVLEIGFGNGGFLSEIARRHPELDFLGVECAMASVSRAFRRLHRNKVSNAKVLHARAEYCVRDILEPASITRCFVNFPDPWPNDAHHHRRIFRDEFLRLLSTRLVPGGEIILTTDHENYFADAEELSRSLGLFEVQSREPDPEYLETKWARRWVAERRTIQQLSLRLRSADTGSYEQRTEVCEMYHILMQGNFDGILDGGKFEKQSFKHANGTIILMDAYFSADRNRMLFMVMNEGFDLRQEFLIEARPSQSAQVVALVHFGSPLVTPMARDSVRVVADWLKERGWQLVHEAL